MLGRDGMGTLLYPGPTHSRLLYVRWILPRNAHRSTT